MATLIEAVQEGNIESVTVHLKRGADPNECTRLGLSSLHLAAVHDEAEIVQSLIKFGGNVNKLTGWGSSVLHMAAHRGSLSIVSTLLKCGADVNIRDDNNDTPLHLACSEGHIEIVKQLLKARANCNIKNNAGNTAFEECLESNMSAELLKVLNSTAPEPVSDKLPPLIEGCRPLLNQSEFVPDFDVPTNESYSSIINEFSLPGGRVPVSMLGEKPPKSGDLLGRKPPKSGDLLQNYTGTKSMNQAQKFSFVKDRSERFEENIGPPRVNQSKLTLDQSFSGSIDLLQPSCSLSKMLNFENVDITGDSIDSSVYRETYELFQQINAGSRDGNNMASNRDNFSSNRDNFSSNHGNFTSPYSTGSVQFSQPCQDSNYQSDSNFSVHQTKDSTYNNIEDNAPIRNRRTNILPSRTQVDNIIAGISPVLEHATVSAIKAALANIAAGVDSPWPDESSVIEYVSKGEWLYGEDYVLVSNTPLNVQNVHDREGSCSLVFKILHQHYGPLVLKMMVNLLNQSDHDTGQSGTVFLKKQFSAEHSVPISLPYHPNVVQMLHSYNGTTTHFKRYLPLLVPPGLDVDVDMASRTSFLAMREYPFSLKNFVNKFVEQKIKLSFMDKDRIKEELHLVLLLLLQCLFVLHHLKVNYVVHRDIKLDNFLMRHSGQVILIDFGWALNLHNPDGSPAIATDKNDIIAGNPVAWSPEISYHHNTFTSPLLFSSVYDKSDLYALGKMFLSVFEVLGFVEKDCTGFVQCPIDLASIPFLVESISLLDEMTQVNVHQRITVSNTMLSLGHMLFFNGADSCAQILSQYIRTSLLDTQSPSSSVTDVGTLNVIPSLHAAVSKQFISTVKPDDLIASCVPRGADTAL